MQRPSHSFHHRLLVASLAAALATAQTESRIPIGKTSLAGKSGEGSP